LEDRLQPGDMVLGYLLGGSLLAPGLAVLDPDLGAAKEDASVTQPAKHRPAPYNGLADQDLHRMPAAGPIALASFLEDRSTARSVLSPASLPQGVVGDSATPHGGSADLLSLQLAAAVLHSSTPLPNPVTAGSLGSFFASNTSANFSSSKAVGQAPVVVDSATNGSLAQQPERIATHAQPAASPAAAQPVPADPKQIQESYGRLPLAFEANQGQADARVQFLSHGSGYSLALAATEAVLSFQRLTVSRGGEVSEPQVSAATVLDMQLLGANAAPQVVGRDELPGKVNYYVGNDPRQWHTNLATYARVEYQNVYAGINLVYYGKGQQLEYDFVVAPGADPRTISLGFTGADQVSINAQGDLVLHTAGGDIQQHKPFLYQDVGGVRQEIAGSFVLRGPQQVGFQVGAYDPSRPLVIDPAYVYSSFLGGTGDDAGNGIAVDGNGFAYVTGYTDSPPATWPVPAPALFGPLGGIDAFVTKVDVSGMFLQWTDFIGGLGTDVGQAIALGAGGVYIAGSTSSPTFPAFNFQAAYGGGASDGFAARFNPVNGALLNSTFLGGRGNDAGFGIAVDNASNVYVTGYTSSPPGTWGALSFVFGPSGGKDAFAIRLDPTLSFETYLTYVCGTRTDIGYGIAVDGNQAAYVTGETQSPNFVTTAGVVQPVFGGGGSDAFVFKLRANGGLIWSTFYGGPGDDGGYGIAVDANGNPVVTGYFDVGAGNTDAFLIQLNANAAAFLCFGFLGGIGTDVGQGVALDAFGNAYVTGWTDSPNFPVLFPLPGQAALNGIQSAFVAKINLPGCFLVYSTYLGGESVDAGYGIAVDFGQNAYVTGYTTSPVLFPVGPACFQCFSGGGIDAFVTKIR
jgi:hypothetical protein